MCIRSTCSKSLPFFWICPLVLLNYFVYSRPSLSYCVLMLVPCLFERIYFWLVVSPSVDGLCTDGLHKVSCDLSMKRLETQWTWLPRLKLNDHNCDLVIPLPIALAHTYLRVYMWDIFTHDFRNSVIIFFLVFFFLSRWPSVIVKGCITMIFLQNIFMVRRGFHQSQVNITPHLNRLGNFSDWLYA